MEHVDLSKVDAKMRTDPDAIEKLYTTQKNASAMIAEGKVPANMTQQDITQMGLQKEISYVDKPESAMEIVQRLSRGRRG